MQASVGRLNLGQLLALPLDAAFAWIGRTAVVEHLLLAAFPTTFASRTGAVLTQLLFALLELIGVRARSIHDARASRCAAAASRPNLLVRLRGEAEVGLLAADFTATLHDVKWGVGGLGPPLARLHEVRWVAHVVVSRALEPAPRAELNDGTLGIHQLRLLDRVRALLRHRLSDGHLLEMRLLEVVLRCQLLLRLNILDLVTGEVRLAERSGHFSITD